MKSLNFVKLLTFALIGASVAYGQATRTWVSGVGDDANPCSRTAPCKTFAGAIAKTVAGGEIDALDPGGFGALTITKSITLDGGGGQVASVLVAGTNGIVVAGGATDVIIIRNLRLDGLLGNGSSGNAGLSGIRFLSGANLNIENCVIFGFSNNGIDIATNASGAVHIINTVVANLPETAAAGLGVGIRATSSAGTVQVGVDHSTITLTRTGIEAAANSSVTVTNSVVEHASGNALTASASGAQMSVSNSDVAYSDVGFLVAAGATGTTAFTNYAYNGACSLNNSGTLTTFGNNRFIGPGNCGPITTAPQG